LALLRAGSKVSDAMASVDRTVETYKDWRKQDLDFRREVDFIREAADRQGSQEAVPDFPEFCAKYLGHPLGEHHLRVWDVMCGREPRDMHPSMTYRPGWRERVIVNMPPEHAKSSIWSIDYVVWRIHRDPNIRIVIVSETLNMAKKYLWAIKNRLTSSQYREMHLRYAPQGGWRDPDESWTSTMIYVQGKGDGEKDPTVQALGTGGQIQGARADLVILDDVQTLKTLGQTEALADWISQDVLSRLPPEERGILLDLGTRVGAMDIHRTLRDEYKDFEDQYVFTFLKMPAVLEYADSVDDWVTLWPCSRNAKGEDVRAWPGRALARRRSEMRDDRMWSTVYQQEDVAINAVFPPEAIEASVNGRRNPGPLKGSTAWGHATTMEQCYVVGGLDPAVTGYTAAVVMAVERGTNRRFVLTGFNKRDTTPAELRSMMHSLTEEYGIREWRVEINAFQRSIVQDEDLKQWLYARGCVLQSHYTTSNKYDPDFGISAMAPLFLSCVEADASNGRNWKRREGLIELPNKRLSAPVSALCEQLVMWQPGQKNLIQDMVMALWFAEIGVREWIGVTGPNRLTHLHSPFATRRDRKLQLVVPMNELEVVGRV
jgi:hypothetical protein